MAVSIPITVFWDVSLHNVVERMTPAGSPKAPVPVYQTKWWRISEDCDLNEYFETHCDLSKIV
jgi:hypothetical protein